MGAALVRFTDLGLPSLDLIPFIPNGVTMGELPNLQPMLARSGRSGGQRRTGHPGWRLFKRKCGYQTLSKKGSYK